ncbi:MAG TPA: sigma-70 family RNA polymerase sigma factor [Caulobacteraceae bacterium]|nr:sigma-70 family RNA polymerase sigma factor [Caulobacteraceae bacterium]
MTKAPVSKVETEGPPGPEDLAAWASRYGPALRRYFLKKVSPAEADDLVQEVFARLQARSTETPLSNVEGYLFRSAANVLVSHYRAESGQGWNRHRHLDPWMEPREEISPERTLLGKEAIERVVASLHDMPARSREAFVMHRFEELSGPMIAQRMGISLKGVEALLARAMRHVTAAMEERP